MEVINKYYKALIMNDNQNKQVELENRKITDNIKKIKHRIVVFSGKGGVGKRP